MNRNIRKMFLLALVAVFAVAPTAMADGPNLLVNPGFEDGYNGWFTFGSGPNLSTPSTDNIARTDTAAAKIFGEFTLCPTPVFDVGGFGQAFTMPTVGNVYELSGWSYMSSADPIPGTSTCGGNRVVAQIAFFNVPVGGSPVLRSEIVIGDYDTPLDQWIPFSVEMPCPPGALRVEALVLFLQPGCDTGSIFVDDMNFCESTPTAETNVLANPSFDTSLTGWTTFANAVFDGRVFARRTPTGGAKLYGPFSVPGAASGMYQSFPTVQGQQWDFSVYALNTCEEDPIEGTNDNVGLIQLLFRDELSNEIGTTDEVIVDNTAPLGTWTKHAISATAPPAAESVEAYILFVQPTDSLLGGAMWVDDAVLNASPATGVGETPSNPDMTLQQNVPNPFNPTTRIDFHLAHRDVVDLVVYDTAGRLVARLFAGELDAGPHYVTWDGRTTSGAMAATGIYHYVLRTTTGQVSRKMVLLK